MRRKITGLLLCFLLIFLFGGGLCQAATTIYFNGKPMKVQAVTKDGMVYAPVSAFTSELKTYDAWYPDIKAVLFNGKYFQNWFLYKGEMYLPIREITDAAGGTLRLTDDGNIYISATAETAMQARHAVPLREKNSSATKLMPKVSPLSPNKAAYTPHFPQRTEQTPSSGDLYPFPSASSRVSNANYSVSPSSGNNSETVYPRSESKGEGVVTPIHAIGSGDSVLSYPTSPELSGIKPPDTGFSSQMLNVPSYTAIGAFEPVSQRNGVYSVTVTNIEEVKNIKNIYNAAAGSKYWIVYISQQNISSEAQIYTGKFTIVDENSKVYDYLEGLSNYWLAILKPGGVNYGYLVFEVPENARPSMLVLNALSQPPLSVGLGR